LKRAHAKAASAITAGKHSRTYRGSGVSAKEAMNALRTMMNISKSAAAGRADEHFHAIQAPPAASERYARFTNISAALTLKSSRSFSHSLEIGKIRPV